MYEPQSNGGKLIVFCLDNASELTAEEIAESTNMPLFSTLSYLKILREKEVVECTNGTYRLTPQPPCP